MVKSRPNILFIFTDQLRADCIAALGNSQIKTPNIDRLVREGTAFTHCYTPSPVCMPARHALTCGAPPHQTGCVDNLPISCDRGSFMDGLNELGYQTHGIGKMHFVKAKGDWGFQTREHAEEIMGESARDDYRDYLSENGYEHVQDPYGFRSEYYYLPQPSQLPDRLHNNAWVADRSIEFLKNRDKEKPFFLWSSWIKPHPPFEAPVPWSRLYRMHEMDSPYLPEDYEDQRNFWSKVQCRYKYMDSGESKHLTRMIRAAYYSVVSHLDFHIGRVLDALGPEIDNTLIVFSSDHGEMLGDFGCYGKRSMLDASVKVPMLARLPGTFEAGAKTSQAASLLDLFPTFLEIAGGSVNETIEGISLQRLQDRDPSERFVHSQFSQNQLGLYMVANKDWKYIYSAPDDKEWLYKDGCESVNLANDSDYADVLASVRQLAIDRFKKDGYDQAIEGDDWARFPKAEFPSDPNDGLLFQDPPTLQPSIGALGPDYARNEIDKSRDEFNILRRLGQRSMLTLEEIREAEAATRHS
ncbi:sulfatase-like hydrolase/transferase [Pelagicoccus sp. NFK12]|uniref:Sulfatase-like hydrolase/transferase n=1 Tax=Pelagicoccus enzymogenes TaxID=2773457 RepID=A0A927FAA1_9BACT|nr:sulfatase-like hydrolase/transferase [Pelagicoccus enzymogenes]MBD5780035.1 sulfatase-like hydrolase/transferase [Pelagicoccus enzymogenes]